MEIRNDNSSGRLLFITTTSVMLGVLSYGTANFATEIMKNNGITNKFILNFGTHALTAAAATGSASFLAKIISKMPSEQHISDRSAEIDNMKR